MQFYFQNFKNRIPYYEVLDNPIGIGYRKVVSREEQLLSERRRISTWGITNYEIHKDSGTIVFPAASTIYQCIHPERPVMNNYYNPPECNKFILEFCFRLVL